MLCNTFIRKDLIMKLINSLREENIKNGLVKYTKELFFSPLGFSIIKFLEKDSLVGKVNIAYVLKIIPDQSENMFFILINGKVVVELEIERQNCENETTEYIKIINQIGIKEYENSIKGMDDKLSLMIAIKLSNEE